LHGTVDQRLAAAVFLDALVVTTRTLTLLTGL
jgi:hypothetical protein